MTVSSSPEATPISIQEQQQQQDNTSDSPSKYKYLIQSPHYTQIYQYSNNRENYNAAPPMLPPAGASSSSAQQKFLPLSSPSTHQLLTSHLSTPPLNASQQSRHSFLVAQVSSLQKSIQQLEMLKGFLMELKRHGSIGTYELERTPPPLPKSLASASNLNDLIPTPAQTAQLMSDAAQRATKPTDPNLAASQMHLSHQFIQSFLIAKQKLADLLVKFSHQLSSNVLFHRYLLQLEWTLIRDNLWLFNKDGSVKIGFAHGENGIIVRELHDPQEAEQHRNKHGSSSLQQNKRLYGSVEYVFPQGIAYGFKEERLRFEITNEGQQEEKQKKEHVNPYATQEEQSTEYKKSEYDDASSPLIDPENNAALRSTSYNLPSRPVKHLNSQIELAHNSLFYLQLFRYFSQIAFQCKDKIQILSYEQNEICIRVSPPNYYLKMRISKGKDHPFWVLDIEQNCIKEENGGNELVKILLEDALYRVHLHLKSSPVTTFQSEQERKNRAFSKKHFPYVSQWFLNVLYYLRHAVFCERVRQLAPEIELVRFSYPERSDCMVYIGPNNEQRVPLFIQGTWICIGYQKLQLGELKAKLALMEDESRRKSQYQIS